MNKSDSNKAEKKEPEAQLPALLVDADEAFGEQLEKFIFLPSPFKEEAFVKLAVEHHRAKYGNT